VEAGLEKLNPIFYPRYWLGLQVDDWPAYVWTDGFTPGPDWLSNPSKYYNHWGSLGWVACSFMLIIWSASTHMPYGP
jgi:hypothetical protein